MFSPTYGRNVLSRSVLIGREAIQAMRGLSDVTGTNGQNSQVVNHSSSSSSSPHPPSSSASAEGLVYESSDVTHHLSLFAPPSSGLLFSSFLVPPTGGASFFSSAAGDSVPADTTNSNSSSGSSSSGSNSSGIGSVSGSSGSSPRASNSTNNSSNGNNGTSNSGGNKGEAVSLRLLSMTVVGSPTAQVIALSSLHSPPSTLLLPPSSLCPKVVRPRTVTCYLSFICMLCIRYSYVFICFYMCPLLSLPPLPSTSLPYYYHAHTHQ